MLEGVLIGWVRGCDVFEGEFVWVVGKTFFVFQGGYSLCLVG